MNIFETCDKMQEKLNESLNNEWTDTGKGYYISYDKYGECYCFKTPEGVSNFSDDWNAGRLDNVKN